MSHFNTIGNPPSQKHPVGLSMIDFGMPNGNVLFQGNEIKAAEQTRTNALTVTGGMEGTDYSYQNNVLMVKTSTPLTITGTTTTAHIEVDKNVTANITLEKFWMCRNRWRKRGLRRHYNN